MTKTAEVKETMGIDLLQSTVIGELPKEKTKKADKAVNCLAFVGGINSKTGDVVALVLSKKVLRDGNIDLKFGFLGSYDSPYEAKSGLPCVGRRPSPLGLLKPETYANLGTWLPALDKDIYQSTNPDTGQVSSLSVKAVKSGQVLQFDQLTSKGNQKRLSFVTDHFANAEYKNYSDIDKLEADYKAFCKSIGLAKTESTRTKREAE